MTRTSRFVGREIERSTLGALVAAARSGRGTLVLVAGEAGVGKSRLVAESIRESGIRALMGASVQGDQSPYSPIVQVLRARLRQVDRDPAALGSLALHLAVLLPELGPPPTDAGGRAAPVEAIRRALWAIAESGVSAIILDDLQWADEATLGLLLAVGDGVGSERLLLIGAYRSDEISRTHPVRRMRTELRRRGTLRELVLKPFPAAETARLAAEILGGSPSPSLAAMLHERSQGVPFFIEELAWALSTEDRLREGRDGLEIVADDELPLPDSIRDAVLLRTHGLSARARNALEAASVIGVRLDPALVGVLGGDETALVESVERGLLTEGPEGQVAFRHALTREAVYLEIHWPRRRSLHRLLAAELTERGSPPDVRAAHWEAAREFGAARDALVEAAEASWRVHAYRDAMRAARRALELWPEGEDEAARLAVLDRLGGCAELSGDLAEAIRSWTEVAQARKRHGNLYAFAELQRRLGAVHALQGSWERALTAHCEAADAFATHGLPGDAAMERLVAAEYLESAGSRRAALHLVLRAADEAARGDRTDLVALSLGLEGQLRVQLGEIGRGLEAARAGLDLALDHGLAGEAAQLHYHHANVLVEVGDYASARSAFQAGVEFCRARGVPQAEHLCLTCFGGVLIEIGEWDRASAVLRDLLATPDTTPDVRLAATCVQGLLCALQGRPRPARRRLTEVQTLLQGTPAIALELSVLWGQAVVDELDGAPESAADRIRALRHRWSESDELYYVIHPLRWATTFLATHGMGSEARACTDVLAGVVAAKGGPEAVAALSHALGECALLDGAPDRAIEHFDHALEILKRLGIAFQHAHTQVRSGAALGAAGHREAAAERFAGAYRTASRMGARPLAESAAGGLRDLGESLERHLGKRSGRRLDSAGLTRRELQVLGLVNQGRSNREIARDLFLSHRTVEMHVSNALLKLGCSSRTEAAHRARELGVIA